MSCEKMSFGQDGVTRHAKIWMVNFLDVMGTKNDMSDQMSCGQQNSGDQIFRCHVRPIFSDVMCPHPSHMTSNLTEQPRHIQRR